MPHLDDAYTLAKWLTANAADAEDVVQEACVRALRALESATVERPRAWLLAIVRNTAFTWLAKNRPKAVLVVNEETITAMADAAEGPDPPPTPEEAVIAAAEGHAVVAAIEGLPQHFREVLVMREINGMSYREIGEATGVPIGTVMSRLARARALLIERFARAP